MTSIHAQTHTVNGRVLRCFVAGEGVPTVVFESGLGASAAEWAVIQPRLAAITRTFSYDRAGYGGSAVAGERHPAAAAADDLVGLLRTAAVPEPYILVGHSWGGVVARFAAAKLAGQIAGLVLVDATHESLTLQSNPLVLAFLDLHYRRAIRQAESGALSRRIDKGKNRLLRELLDSYPADVQARLKEEYSTPGFHRASRAEAKGLRQSLRDLPAVALPEVPIVAVTGGRASRLDRRTRRQITQAYRQLVESVPQGRHVIAENSGHFVPQHDPDLLVGVIEDLVVEVRRSADIRSAP